MVQQTTNESKVQTTTTTSLTTTQIPQPIPIISNNKNTKIVLLSTTTIPATIKPALVNVPAVPVPANNIANFTIAANNQKPDNSTIANSYILSECDIIPVVKGKKRGIRNKKVPRITRSVTAIPASATATLVGNAGIVASPVPQPVQVPPAAVQSAIVKDILKLAMSNKLNHPRMKYSNKMPLSFGLGLNPKEFLLQNKPNQYEMPVCENLSTNMPNSTVQNSNITIFPIMGDIDLGDIQLTDDEQNQSANNYMKKTISPSSTSSSTDYTNEQNYDLLSEQSILQKYGLNESILSDSDDPTRQYVCRHCGKKYRWKSTLRRHENVECGGKEASHQCPYCQYRAKQKGNLGVHVRKHHPNMPQLETRRRSSINKMEMQ